MWRMPVPTPPVTLDIAGRRVRSTRAVQTRNASGKGRRLAHAGSTRVQREPADPEPGVELAPHARALRCFPAAHE